MSRYSTLPPPSPRTDEERREVRRAAYLAEATPAAVEDVHEALTSADRRRLLGVIGEHLGRAWDDGAGPETDLRMSIEMLRAEVITLRAMVDALCKRLEELVGPVDKIHGD